MHFTITLITYTNQIIFENVVDPRSKATFIKDEN